MRNPVRDDGTQPVDASLSDIDGTLRILAESITPRSSFVAEIETNTRPTQNVATSHPFLGDVSRQTGPDPRRHQSHARPLISSWRWRLFSGLAAALALITLATGAAWWTQRPQSVSAQAILQEASALSPTSLSSAHVQSFHVKRESSDDITLPNGQRDTVTYSAEWWVSLPNHWRTELRTHSTLGSDVFTGAGSDGSAEWSYQTQNGKTVARIGALPVGTTVPLPSVTIPAGNVQPGTQVDYGKCYHAKLMGEATILGRPAYTLDLGPDLCARNLPPNPRGTAMSRPRGSVVQGGRTLVWVDKQTFFALKRESFGADGRLESRDEVTDLAYDAAIPDRTFTFSSQQGDSVEDLRPQPYNPPIPPPIVR